MVKHPEKEACEPGASDVHARLITAACELLIERGYRGATTREIAQHAGVTEMTLFRHFSSKEALIQLGLEKGTEGMADMVPEPTGNVENDLLHLLDGYHRMWDNKMATTLENPPGDCAQSRTAGERHPRGYSALPRTTLPFLSLLPGKRHID